MPFGYKLPKEELTRKIALKGKTLKILLGVFMGVVFGRIVDATLWVELAIVAVLGLLIFLGEKMYRKYARSKQEV